MVMTASMKPLKRYESFTSYGFNQFLPLVTIQFCFIVIYILLKSYKNLILGGLEADPYVRPAIESWSTVPMMLLFLGGYLKLSNHFRREQLFYISLGAIMIPLAVLTFWVHPNGQVLSMKSATIQGLRENYSHMQFAIIWAGRWIETLMCSFATLWGPVFVYMYIWQFANDVTNLVKARVFYPVFIFLGGIPYVVGQSIVSHSVPQGVLDADKVMVVLQRYIVISLLLSAVAAYVYWRYHKAARETNADHPPQSLLKLHVIQSLNSAFSDGVSRRLIILAVGVSFILEVMSTLLMKLTQITRVNQEMMAGFMDGVTGYIGAMGKFTVILVLIAMFRLRQKNWSGLATITGVAFSGLVVALYVIDYMGYLLVDQMVFAVPLGVFVVAVLMVLTEGVKFYWYLPAREMVFLTLSQEHRIKSKAIADLLGVALGLTLARLAILVTQQIGGGDFFVGLSYLMGVTILVAMVWLKSIVDLQGYMAKAEMDPLQNKA